MATMNTRETAKWLAFMLRESGYESYFCGGAVRDMLLNREPKDIDLVTSALPDQIESVFSDLHCIPTGKSFGVITVVVEGEQFEVATFRADGVYEDGRRPNEVRFVTTLQEDGARRDFSINSMYLDPYDNKIIDFFGGQKDLQDGIIQFVGNPHTRIQEDYLRMLRGVRFALRYGFKFVDDVFLETYLKDLSRLSRERIRDEFEEILMYSRGLEYLHSLGMMPYIIPGIENLWGLSGLQDSTYHAEGDTWTHTLAVVEILRHFDPSNFRLLLAGLLHDIGKPATQKCCDGGRITNHGHAEVGARMAENICRHWLKLSSVDTDFVATLVANHMKMHHVDGMKKSTLIKLAESPYIQEMMWLQHADATGRETALPKFSHLAFMGNKLEEFKLLPARQQPHSDHIIRGLHILACGILPGPAVKAIKEAARIAQFAGEFDETNYREWLKEHIDRNHANDIVSQMPQL